MRSVIPGRGRRLDGTFASGSWRRPAEKIVGHGGATLQEVKDLLGHASLAMTLRYGHLAPEHLRTAVARLDAKLPAKSPMESPMEALEAVRVS
jgi:integrase